MKKTKKNKCEDYFTSKDITVICHPRRNFYNGRNIYWYKFMTCKKYFDFSDLIPCGFLNVPYTSYYEFGGTHEDAIKELTFRGFSDIINGEEI